MNDSISRKMAIDLLKRWSDGYSYIEVETNSAIKAFEEMAPTQPTYTNEEIQKMADLEQAEIEKAYQLGYEEGKKDAQSEYKPVTAEDFAKVMQENTLYQYMTWYGMELALMNRMGFVICKKVM